MGARELIRLFHRVFVEVAIEQPEGFGLDFVTSPQRPFVRDELFYPLCQKNNEIRSSSGYS